MRILVTGGTGFIGRNLLDYYRAEEVTAPGRGEILCGSPDVVIHAAAEVRDESRMVEANLGLTMQVLEFCRRVRPEKLVILGSSSEYARRGQPLTEHSPLEPTTMYETTKTAASLLAEGYSRTHGIPITLVRPFTVVGRHEKPYKFFPTLYRAARLGSPIQLGPGVHDYVFIDEFLKAFDLIMRFQEREAWNVVNVGSGVQTSNREMLAAFEVALGLRYNVEEVGTMRSYDSDSWVCDNRLLREKYQAGFQYDIQSGVAHFVTDCRRLSLYCETPGAHPGYQP